MKLLVIMSTWKQFPTTSTTTLEDTIVMIIIIIFTDGLGNPVF